MGQEVSRQLKVKAKRWMLGCGGLVPASPPICEMHIRDQNQSLSFFLLAQFIVYTKVPIWVGSSKKGVLKGWVGLGTCILKRACSKGGTKEHIHTTIQQKIFIKE